MQGILFVLIGAAFLMAHGAQSADKLYWTNKGNPEVAGSGSIQVGNQCGIAPALSLFTNETSPLGLTIHATANKIFWGSSTGVRVANLDGSGFAKTLYVDNNVLAVTMDPVTRNIYWVNDSGAIKVANLDGSGIIQTLFSNEGASALTIDQNRIYWTNFSDGEIRWGFRNNTAGGEGTVLYPNEVSARGIALDQISQTLYWTNSTVGGTIRVGKFKVLTTGEIQASTVNTLYSNENTPTGISIDSASRKVYWANSSTGDIRVGSTNGSLQAVSLYSLQNNPSFPIILQVPVAVQEPRVIPSCKEDQCGNTKPVLYCSSAYFAGDNFSSFLYRVGVMSYSWFLNGVEVATTIKNEFTPSGPGSYTCEATSTNPAGECTMSSQ